MLRSLLIICLKNRRTGVAAEEIELLLTVLVSRLGVFVQVPATFLPMQHPVSRAPAKAAENGPSA